MNGAHRKGVKLLHKEILARYELSPDMFTAFAALLSHLSMSSSSTNQYSIFI